MSDLMSQFFGPLDKGACKYFLIISGIFLFILILSFGFVGFNAVNPSKKQIRE